jgi:hypothetical protein
MWIYISTSPYAFTFFPPQTKGANSFLQFSQVFNTKILLLATLFHLHTSRACYAAVGEYPLRFAVEYCDGFAQSIKLWGQKTPLLGKHIPEVKQSTIELRLLSSQRFDKHVFRDNESFTGISTDTS